MANNVNEFRQRILEAVERQKAVVDARRAVDLPAAVIAPLNPLGAGVDTGFDGGFATGYNSGLGVTEAPFVVGISLVGGDDIVVGS